MMQAKTILVGVVTALAVASHAFASDTGLVLHANGFVQGKSDISDGSIKCDVPSVSTSIADGAYAMGIWNTYGAKTLFFPDPNNGQANPCGGWLQLQNNSMFEGINIERVRLKFRILGARRWRTLVPTRAGLPSACAAMRRTPLFTGVRLDPFGGPSHSNSGAANVAHVQLVPMVRSELIHCLRAAYDWLPTETFVDLPLVIEARASGVSDSGSRYETNTVRYTLNLRHTCGNYRTDDGEECDPGDYANSPCYGGVCKDNVCSLAENVSCIGTGACIGTCVPRGDPNECTCQF